MQAILEHEETEAHGREQLEELGERIRSRQQLIQEEQESVEQKIAEATRPATAKRDRKAEVHAGLQAEVEALRYSPLRLPAMYRWAFDHHGWGWVFPCAIH